MISLLLLISLVSISQAAYCGSSAIPYSFEVLPDGTFSLGCARPSCFGYEPTTGNWASQDYTFTQAGNHADGFLRNTDPMQRAPFMSPNPQMATCFTSASCTRDQWAAGYSPNTPGFPLICCHYPTLAYAQDIGIANLHPGEITTGGEKPEFPGYFDYIRNIQAVRQPNGQIERYEVSIGRMQCVEPTPIQLIPQTVQQPLQPVQQPLQPLPQPVQQPPQVAAPYYPPAPAYVGSYQPIGGLNGLFAGGFRCFTGDSMVTLANGSIKRMDELSVGDWVKSPQDNLFGVRNTPVDTWLHRLPDKETEFLVLTTTSGKELKMTEDHYLYRSQCNGTRYNKPEMVRAGDITVGDCLLEAQNNSFSPVKVIRITVAVEKGIYAPLTNGGKIIVNDLMVSCFSDTKNDVLVQTMRNTVVNCDSKERLESLECSIKDTGISLLLDMVKFSIPDVLY